jgi:hypothetical protein
MFDPFLTTGIGSLPFTDPDEAVQLVLHHCDIPFWPQLPACSFREFMIPQYSEGFPGIDMDTQEKNIVISPDEHSLSKFYEIYSGSDDFPISESYAHGLFAFFRHLEGKNFSCLKGQVTGPLSFSLSLKDSDGRFIYFNEELREISSLLLQRKAQWQVRALSRFAGKVIIFIDEPILTAIGSSSYIGVESSEVERLLRDSVSAIKSAGGIAGIHCCGKADWGMVIRTGVDILNFDAYDYFHTLKIYAEEVGAFLERGGYVAWGIVPTTEAIQTENPEDLLKMLRADLKELSTKAPADLIWKNSLLTPSCGAGSRSVDETRKVFTLLQSIGREMKN